MTVAYLDVSGGNGGRGGYDIADEDEPDPVKEVTVEEDGKGLSLPKVDSFLFSLSFSLSSLDLL